MHSFYWAVGLRWEHPPGVKEEPYSTLVDQQPKQEVINSHLLSAVAFWQQTKCCFSGHNSLENSVDTYFH